MKKLYSLFAAVVMTVTMNAQTTTVLTEDFSSYTKGGNTNSNGTNGPDGDDVYVKGTNVSTFPTGTKVYQAGGMAKVGGSKDVGSMTTSELDLSTNGGNVRVSFDVKGWTSVEGPIKVTVGSSTKEVTYTAKMSDELENVSVEFPETGTSSSTVSIGTTSKRAFVDNVKIETYSISTPVLTVDKTSVEFPETLVESSSEAQTLTVTGENLDAAPAYELSGADASEFSVSGSLTAEGGALSLTFHPATSGTKTATLTVTSGSLSQMVTLSGEGKALPVLNVDNAAIEFPQTLIGSTSEAQTLTVTGENLDAVPTYELSGADASEFSVSGSLTAEGGALSLTFHPATSGTKTATLTITSGSLTETVALSGEGKALPVLTVDTDSLEFPETVVGQTSDEKIVEVNWANVSDFPTYNITGDNADEFEVLQGELKTDETGGYLHIVFTPSSAGTKTATLTITADGISKTVALSGTGVEDSSLSVGDTHTVKTGLVKNTLVDNVLVFTAKSEVNIYNFSGQTVKTASVSENTAVDVTGLPKGVYIVTGVVNGKNISQKIIKK